MSSIDSIAIAPLRIVVNRTVRVIDPYEPNPLQPHFLGCGGEHCVFELPDGRRIHSNSVWYERDARTDEPDTVKLIHTGRGDCPAPFLNVTGSYYVATRPEACNVVAMPIGPTSEKRATLDGE